jgi:purine-binding chemotaxis protein CheW
MAEKYLVFVIQDRYYALPSRIVSEVAALEKIFPLPLADPHVRGIINRYSVPYALVDIGILFTGTVTEASKVIVLKEEVDRLAFLIGDVADILDIPPEQLLAVEEGAPGETGGDRSSPVKTSFEWKDKTVLCLDIDALLEAVRGNGDGPPLRSNGEAA